jgi:hypothetical protein
MLVLGLALLTVTVLCKAAARRTLTALGFVFCAVLAGRYVPRFTWPLTEDATWCVAPGVLLLCAAWGMHAFSRRRATCRSFAMPLSGTMCAGAGTLGYLCLAPVYSLEAEVLRAMVLNGVLAACSWSLMMGLRPRKGLALMVCVGLFLCAGMVLS